MKISANGEELYSLTETQKKVIKSNIPDEIFDADMVRRLGYAVFSEYERCLNMMVKEWQPIIKTRVPSVPVKADELAQLIISQSDYKDRNKREEDRLAASKAIEELKKSQQDQANALRNAQVRMRTA